MEEYIFCKLGQADPFGYHTIYCPSTLFAQMTNRMISNKVRSQPEHCKTKSVIFLMRVSVCFSDLLLSHSARFIDAVTRCLDLYK